MFTSPDHFAEVPQLCGTCEHEHLPFTGHPDCPGFTLHPTTREQLDERELAELIELAGERTLLSVAESANLLHMLKMWESEAETLGWDRPPILAAISATRSHIPAPAIIGSQTMTLHPLALPGTFWAQAHPTHALRTLADRAADHGGWWRQQRRTAGLDPAIPQIAWAWCWEGWVKAPEHQHESANNNPKLREDETRCVLAVDVDARLYTVMRRRSQPAELWRAEVETLPAYQQIRRDAFTRTGGIHGSTNGQLDPAYDVLARLMAVQRRENTERARRKARGR
jgi:hypothetical protein